MEIEGICIRHKYDDKIIWSKIASQILHKNNIIENTVLISKSVTKVMMRE